MKRFLIIFTIVLAVAGLSYWSYLQSGLIVDVTTAKKTTIRAYIEERAKTRVPEIFEITMPLNGRIKPIELREGDLVNEGAVVAQMDDSDLKTDLNAGMAQRNQFDALLKSMESTIDAAKEQITASLAKFEFEDREYKRVSKLSESSAVSASELGSAELAQFESRVDHRKDVLNWRALEAITSALAIGRADSEETRQKRERDLNRSQIKSTVSGTVLKRHVSNERVLQAGTTLLEVGQLDKLEVVAEILTQQAVEISVGDKVEIGGPTIGTEPLWGKVTQIYPQGFTKISSLGVEEQRVLVVIQFDEAVEDLQKQLGRTLGIGYRLRVKILTAEKPEAIVISRTCLFRGAENQWTVFVIRNEKAVKTNVELGLMNDFQAEITSGLQEGNLVVLAPDSELTDQARVKLEK